MQQTVQSHCKVKEVEHCWIPMPDGTRLSARLWLPILPKDERSPAILEYIPYRKRDMVRARDERNHSVFACAGYACVRVDMRGSGDSEGQMMDMYDTKELDDAVEVINWIATQPWCTGSVGMMGTSWGGTSALQTAARRPEALKAIVAVCATNNRYEDDIHHMGGCLLTDTVEWGATLPAILASPPDPETVGPGWRALWKKRLEGLSFPLENWIRHETKNEYWRWGSVSEYPEAITCPVLMIGGWSDRYSNTVMNFLEQGHDRCWGIIGPWGHHYP
ncbi:MAG: CocE/NonD family hydrolase, partial [Gammaproteobacteria bacterium]